MQEELRRANYVTPKNYLDFINNYKRALKSNRQMVEEQTARLSGGLQKLIQVRQAAGRWRHGFCCFPWTTCTGLDPKLGARAAAARQC
jgi:hypothetical protein